MTVVTLASSAQYLIGITKRKLTALTMVGKLAESNPKDIFFLQQFLAFFQIFFSVFQHFWQF